MVVDADADADGDADADADADADVDATAQCVARRPCASTHPWVRLRPYPSSRF